MAPATGRVLGKYVLGTVIGRGGMSEVFAAQHRELGHPVAVKVLKGDLAADAAQATRFVREATRTLAIDHPNVVRVIDFGRAEDDGALYLVMERLDGEDLKARLLRRGRLGEAEVRGVGAAVADGLEAAHARGIVHGDLKPANILMLADGSPKIVDFGISTLLGAAVAAPAGGGGGGELLGTVQYMAPEQLSGGPVGPHIDIWALGVVLFEMLTGKQPFSGFVPGRWPQLSSAPRAPSELVSLSAELEGLILACLQKKPRERPASMQAIADRLRGVTAAREAVPVAPAAWPVAPPPRESGAHLIVPTVARESPAPPAATPPAPPRRRIILQMALATALLALLAMALALLFAARQAHGAPPPPPAAPPPT